jgi:hypothetical protein
MSGEQPPTPAGWYQDPGDAAQLRYWDGNTWTEHRSPAHAPAAVSSSASGPGASPEPPPSGQHVGGSGTVGDKKRNTVGIVALSVAIIGFIFACIPGALIVGWILLPIAFILSIVGLLVSGKKWQAVTGLIVSIVGTLVGVLVFLFLVGDAVDEAFEDIGSAREFSVKIDGAEKVQDSEGRPALRVDMTFTNEGEEAADFLFSATVTALQNGAELETAFLADSDGNQTKKITPGTSIEVQQTFVLEDSSDVTVEVTEAISLSDEVLASETFPIDAEADEQFGDDFKQYEVSIDGSRQAEDFEGQPVLIVDFTFTNNGAEASSFLFSVEVQAFQDGVELEDAFMRDPSAEESNAIKDIEPGKTIRVQRPFLLDGRSDVTVTATELISFDEVELASQIFTIK